MYNTWKSNTPSTQLLKIFHNESEQENNFFYDFVIFIFFVLCNFQNIPKNMKKQPIDHPPKEQKNYLL